MESLTDEDKAKAIRLFEGISRSMASVSEVVQSILSQKEDGLLPTEQGHCLLELKNQMMLSYLINLVHLIYEKVSGESIKDSPDTDRLVEIRTVLEKLQPLEKKFTNRFDRKIKSAVTGVVDKNDPLSFKPNLQSLLSESEDGDSSSKSEEEEEEEEEDEETGVYRPSKAVPTYYDETANKKRERLAERARHHLLRSEMVADLARQYTDAPEEILDSGKQRANRQAEKRGRERTEYEEKYLTRLPPEKKGKPSKKHKSYLKRKGSKRRRTH